MGQDVFPLDESPSELKRARIAAQAKRAELLAATQKWDGS
jgi:hypothetical protein